MKYNEFTAADWSRIRQDWTAWWDGTLERPLVLIWTREPGHPPGSIHDNLVRWPAGTDAQSILDYYQPHLETTHYHGDAFPQWWLNAGPGIVASFLGSAPHFADDGGWGTTWFERLGVDSLNEIHPTYDPHNAWWLHCQNLMKAAIARWGDTVVMGCTDLGGNMDILASLRGTMELLYDCFDNPAEIDRLTRAITALWLRYFDEMQAIIDTGAPGMSYWAEFWSPGPGYMLQSDFCYMISPEMFERFVLPDLETCCAHIEYPFYHLDGKGQLIHLERMLQIPNLRGIQWQPGDGQPLADGWLDVLRQIREAGKLCQVFVNRKGAMTIARELGGAGFQFQVTAEGLTPEEADAFVAEIHALA
ncbi:MAG: hypothetical protein GYB65_11975 [Chloroflexi bacterium]|nr:hypothetical protein [Chloroflexota bacterium]